METDLLFQMRNYLLLGSVVATASMVHDSSESLAGPFLRLISRIKHSMQVLRERFQCTYQNSFWEIDMTKLEP